MVSETERQRVVALLNKLGQHLVGLPPSEIGSALATLSGVWLASYPRQRWAELLRLFSATVRETAEADQRKQQRRENHGQAEANRD